MANNGFHFKVGSFNCSVFRDADDNNQNVLLVDTGSQKVLFDPGSGPVTSPPGLLMERLGAAGIQAADIDVVILSHADFDHVGGTVDADGKPAFPQARYILSREELAFWNSKPVRLQASPEYDQHFLDLENVVPPTCLGQLGSRLETVEFGAEILPGFRSVAANGHTPGQMAIDISSGGQQIMYVGDLFYQPENIAQPGWYSVYDFVPQDAVASRQRLLSQAASNHTLLLAYHLPFPGLGIVTQAETGFGWQASESSA